MADTVEKSEISKKEEETLSFWKEHDIFQKTLNKKAPKGEFIFYEGPPTANGKPGIHHLESRSFKDAIPRYKTMRGYHVSRRAGWDTHGLPVELEVEKQLGFSGKKDIEVYGVAAFNKKCRESVMQYIGEWDRFTKRIGYWVDQSKAYFAFDASYMEVLWHILAKIDTDGRLYKDYKVVPWCPRDETALSSHELAQGYTDVKDLTITAKFELTDEPGTYVLAWTTTPWTLPGNVALAIGKDIAYGVYEKEKERVILADLRAKDVLGEGWHRSADRPAATLIGKRYTPLYPYAKELAATVEKPKFEKAFQIYPAGFVTTEDGTGVVHTAVMYGQEDFELGNTLGLPKVHLVSPEGKFIEGTGAFAGRSVVDDELAVDIVKELAGRGLLFSKGKYEHSYPFCWRCKTRLIYYARDSWYIRMTDLRKTLVAENKKVHWQPDYIRDGRMGEWLTNAKDWAISRERYWGTPLPVWQSADGKERMVIGSVDELKARTKKGNNAYLIMRHGEAESNVQNVTSTDFEKQKTNHLTERGKKEAQESLKRLIKQKIDLIVTSPFMRAQETAKIAAIVLGIPETEIVVDERLREIATGDFDGKSVMAYHELFPENEQRFMIAPPGGETFSELRKRMGDALYDLEKKYMGKRILLISHGDPLWALQLAVSGKEARYIDEFTEPALAEIRELSFVPLPHNENYELDLHRPYIDAVVLIGASGKELHRVSEVMDVWFDSGAMPFAQGARERKSGESLEKFLKTVVYPADYISEAIDQTRGWFYTLLAVGTLMKQGSAYKNVICLGHLLDAEGQKMSKSKGNVIEPWGQIERYGVDTLRFWMYFVNQPGDSKNYDEKTLKEAAKVLSWIENSANFYVLFKEERRSVAKAGQSTVLDRWMRIRLEDTVRTVTAAMEDYRPYDATREIAGLAEDLSQWYVRRARERVREGDSEARETLALALRTCALLLAPFTPFLAERLFATVRKEGDPESVHLANWPAETLRAKSTRTLRTRADQKLLADMLRIRALASDALQLRQKAGIKVRQPLHKLCVPDTFSPELLAVLAEEVNVKHVRTGAATIELDSVLTPELVREGDVREFMRTLADARKALDLSPKDTIRIRVTEEGRVLFGEEMPGGASHIAYDATVDAPYSAELSFGTIRFMITPDAA